MVPGRTHLPHPRVGAAYGNVSELPPLALPPSPLSSLSPPSLLPSLLPPPISPPFSTDCAPRVKPIHLRKKAKPFNFSLYSTRHIALKIAYLGANYGGFEYHANNTFSTPTVEEQIFKALLKARLVPNSGLPGEEETVLGWPGDDAVSYSKCGRTDKGVSAFGQVIGVRVRSNRPLPKPTTTTSPAPTSPPTGDAVLDDGFGTRLQDQSDDDSDPGFDDAKDELIYPQILNRLLPPDIRVLAWCPTPPPGFSARFSCEERRYRYFFTNPPIAPGTANDGAEMLDIDAMRTAAKLFVGDHDFRNFCKLDASKQISRFDRVIKHADITTVDPLPPTFSAARPSPPSSIPTPPPASPACPKLYYLELHGSAFLWHQVRHMVAILFLIGQGLESPTLVSTLLDTTTHPCKPTYEMADDRALVLWDCVFPANTLSWIYAGTAWKDGRDDLVDSVWSLWHQARIDELLAASLLELIAGAAPAELPTHTRNPVSQPVVVGGSAPVYRGRYVPVLDRPRMERVEVINSRYVEKKGDWAENRNRRVEARKAKASAREEEEERRGGGAGVYIME